MAENVQLTFWNYNQFKDYKPHMLEDWINLGMTTPIAPEFHMSSNEELHEKFVQFLDDANSRGVKLILQITDLYLWGYNAESFNKKIIAVKERYGNHPAVAGFFVGEEPHGDAREYFEGIKALKEAFPDKVLYMNMGSIERTERCALQGKETITDWTKRFVETTGSNLIGYGCYAGMLDDFTGIYEHFHNIREFVEAGKAAGADVWATMLSSVHDYYRIPTEDDFRWQLNSCIACGCKGVVWFRIYDKLIAGNYQYSPIDEFGEKTTRYYELARVQKRFNAHYGKIFGTLHHVSTRGIGVSYGGYPYFTSYENEMNSNLIADVSGRLGMVSEFIGDDGYNYVVLLNSDPRHGQTLGLTFTDSVAKVEEVLFNGEQLHSVASRKNPTDPLKFTYCFVAGQMALYRITKK